MSFKPSLLTYFLFFLMFVYCVPALSFSVEDSCFNENKHFISRYFSGRSHVRELESFFECINNFINIFLNHTETENPKYYTKTELSRLILYMGFGQNNPKTEAEARSRALAISQAILNLKTSFIGGHTNRLTLREIAISRKMLSIFRTRMRSLITTVPLLVQVLDKKNIKRAKLLNATNILKSNLTKLGSQLSHISFSSDLSLLRGTAQNLKTLGFTSVHLQYLEPSLAILSQWKKIFLSASINSIRHSEYPLLLDSMAQIMSLWFYHKRFLEGRFWLSTSVIQHAQHFLSYSLNLVRETYKKSGKNGISLQDIDELARRIWFLPYVSKPVFRLGLRSAFCFILEPLTTKKTCKYNIDSKHPDLKISFSDTTFTIIADKTIHESRSGKASDRIKNMHLEVLRQYINSWINTENAIRRTSKIPPLFGLPHRWLNKRRSITSDKRLKLYTNRTDDISFLSYLNWQSHLMKAFTFSYTNREKQEKVTQKLWNIMITEWTAFSVSLYREMKWESFQQLGFQVFKHGDFLTSYSNGDAILQEEEILELFSIFTSSLGTVIASRGMIETCKGSVSNSLRADCVYHHLQYLPPNIFASFPRLLDNLSQNEEKKVAYISRLRLFNNAKEEISIKDLFETFLFIHYQENTMEYLDKDSSQYLSTRELEPLLNVFESTLIEDIPLIYTKREAFAFITYLFHYGEIPIFSEQKTINSPLHFSNWLLKPTKWEEVRADQGDILKTLFLINKRTP